MSVGNVNAVYESTASIRAGLAVSGR